MKKELWAEVEALYDDLDAQREVTAKAIAGDVQAIALKFYLALWKRIRRDKEIPLKLRPVIFLHMVELINQAKPEYGVKRGGQESQP